MGPSEWPSVANLIRDLESFARNYSWTKRTKEWYAAHALRPATPRRTTHLSSATVMASKKAAKGKDSKSAKNGAKASSAGRAQAAAAPEPPKRKLGLRGAAPWAARHAAKHAAEARARAAEPPLPGSARATIRTPAKAEDIKAKIADLHNALQQIKSFRKNLAKGFYDIGIVLRDIRERRLFEAKGFGTFEAFLERETAEL